MSDPVQFDAQLRRHTADLRSFTTERTAHPGAPAAAWAAPTPYPFAAVLEVGEIADLVDDLTATLRRAARTRSLVEHEGTIAAWRSTVEIIADPAVLNVALAPSGPAPDGASPGRS